jgi:hypothetical protein
LAVVLVLQFAEGMTDRQAAGVVQARVDWKYCLAQGDRAGLLLARMLDVLRERGLLAKGGRQRTDATSVLASVRLLNRLELTVETMRAALESLSVAAPAWLVDHAWDAWWDRYAQRADDYRLPRGEGPRTELAVTVGADGYQLLDAVHAAEAPVWLRELPAFEVLRMVWLQQYYRDHQWRSRFSTTRHTYFTDLDLTPQPAKKARTCHK